MKFHRTELVICSHSREEKAPSFSQINKVKIFQDILRTGEQNKTIQKKSCDKFQRGIREVLLSFPGGF